MNTPDHIFLCAIIMAMFTVEPNAIGGVIVDQSTGQTGTFITSQEFTDLLSASQTMNVEKVENSLKGSYVANDLMALRLNAGRLWRGVAHAGR